MKKIIEHESLRNACIRVDSPSGRKYRTPEGNEYPSVTGIVGLIGKEKIDQWKEKVGEEVANKISKRAATRGTLIHENCENYILGKELTFSQFQQEEYRMFKNLLPVLESLEEIHAMESVLYSDKFRYAGTVDLIARVDGELAVLDWKTSSGYKKEEDIPNYFTQCAAYAYAFWEMTGIAIPKIVIAMTTEDFGLLIFKQDTKKWMPSFIEVREKYRTIKGE